LIEIIIFDVFFMKKNKKNNQIKVTKYEILL